MKRAMAAVWLLVYLAYSAAVTWLLVAYVLPFLGGLLCWVGWAVGAALCALVALFLGVLFWEVVTPEPAA